MQAMSAVPLKRCSIIGSIGLGSHAEVLSERRSQGSKHVSPVYPRVRYPFSNKRETSLRLYCLSFCGNERRRRKTNSVGSIRSSSSSSSPSSSSRVEEEEDEAMAVEEAEFEGSPEESNVEDEQAREDLMKKVMQRLSEDDLEEAAKKYNYEDELFSRIDFAQINAFTNKAFSGNPAAVCYLPYEKNEKWFHLVAREFNLPATAFVVKRRGSGKGRASSSTGGGSALLEVEDDGTELKPVKKNLKRIENEFDIRWFSTTSELELCGHGTLASAHMIFSSGLVDGDTIIFHSKKGATLKARKISGYDEPNVAQEDEEDPKARVQSKVELGKGIIELDFPIGAASEVDAQEAKLVSYALGGVETVWVGRTAIGDYLVELPSSKHVEQLQPQFEKMTDFSGRGGVIATARASEQSGLDVISRFFVPKAGILEDPVTGSAHCTLGPYWAAKLGKDTLKAYQASPRGGEVCVRVDSGAGRAYLQGGAVLVMAGTLLNTFQ